MFRAHRGVIRNRALLHRGRKHASIKAHAKRGLRTRRIRGIRYVQRTAPYRQRQARYRSLIKVPASYKQRRIKTATYRGIGTRNPYPKQRKARRYKAVRR